MLMNLCINGTIKSGVEILRARVKYKIGVKGGSAFCSEWHLADLGNNKFVWLGNITDMEAMGAMLNTPEEIQWDKENGAV
tara:strand:+ start:273 stop:512 length:240 start_codon:yes stop_codon:yes gene_type:complete